MKKISTVFLQAVIILVSIGVIAALLWEPQLEGVNKNATNFEIYFKDPFLAYVYIGSIPFFVALYQAFKVLGYVRQDKTFSETALNAVRKIKHCMLILAGAIIGAGIFIRIAAIGSEDDPAGALMLSMIATLISIIVAAAASVFEDILQRIGNQVPSKTSV